jgi:hypothetical protein
LLKTAKIDRFLIQNSIIKIWRKTKKTSNIIGLSFDISYLSIVFLFKIQILNENNKPISFPVYHLVFLIYRSIFQFSFFQKKSNFQKNKSNRPVFNESTKLDQTNFIDFHEKNDIWIHGHAAHGPHTACARHGEGTREHRRVVCRPVLKSCPSPGVACCGE